MSRTRRPPRPCERYERCYGTAMYFVNDVSVHGDDVQEPLMREVVAKLR